MRGEMLRTFINWWVTQLGETIPTRWREPVGDGVVISPLGSVRNGIPTVALSLRRRHRETSLGQFNPATETGSGWPDIVGKPSILRLAEDDVLSKTITLPLAAERDLSQVLAFEMDRETPFTAGDVFWTYRT